MDSFQKTQHLVVDEVNPSDYEQMLKNIKNYDGNKLKSYVAEIILKESEPENFIREVANHGLSGGTVSELIYYHDTHKFFDKFSDEIFELWADTEADMGEFLKPTGDIKNWFAWFGFETAVNEIALEIGIEL